MSKDRVTEAMVDRAMAATHRVVVPNTGVTVIHRIRQRELARAALEAALDGPEKPTKEKPA